MRFWGTSRNLAFVREYGLRACMLQCNLLLQINASQNGAALPLAAQKTLAGSGAWFHRPALPCLDGNLAPVIHPYHLPVSRASWLITGQARAGAEPGSVCEANLRLLYMPQLSFLQEILSQMALAGLAPHGSSRPFHLLKRLALVLPPLTTRRGR